MAISLSRIGFNISNVIQIWRLGVVKYRHKRALYNLLENWVAGWGEGYLAQIHSSFQLGSEKKGL